MRKSDRRIACMNAMSSCIICPRKCGADRIHGMTGVCGQTAQIRAARAALHFWEEPCISGNRGSGTVFFSGCSLGCVFCQNHDIASGRSGKEISQERLAEIFLELQEKKACNINLVTAGHFIYQVAEAIDLAKEQGLSIPVVYNSGGYEEPETLRILEGLVDIYMPDFKYMNPQTARKYSSAPDYPEKAAAALEEMFRQTGEAVFEDGLMKKGVLVRHLVLPGHVKEAEAVIHFLLDHYGNHIWVSIMNQYTPMPDVQKNFPELGRKVTKREYRRVIDDALNYGLECGFIQEGGTVGESFIPPFDMTGI